MGGCSHADAASAWQRAWAGRFQAGLLAAASHGHAANRCQMVGPVARPVGPQVRAVHGSGTSIEYLNPADASECCWLGSPEFLAAGCCLYVAKDGLGAGGAWRSWWKRAGWPPVRRLPPAPVQLPNPLARVCSFRILRGLPRTSPASLPPNCQLHCPSRPPLLHSASHPARTATNHQRRPLL